MITFEEAQKNLDETFNSIYPIAEGIVKKYSEEADKIVKKVSNNIENLSKNELRSYMIKLSSEVYIMSDVRERAALRQELASMLHKEAAAKAFNTHSGTAKEKDNQAYLDSLSEKMVEVLHATVESQLKTKINSINTVIDNLKSVLISRISEDKNTNI